MTDYNPTPITANMTLRQALVTVVNENFTGIEVEADGAASAIADLQAAATNDVTHAELTTALAPYLTSASGIDTTELASELAGYVSDADLLTALAGKQDAATAATDTELAGYIDPTELANAINAHTGDATAAHAASAISFTPQGTIAATDVQAAIQEVRDEAGSGTVTTGAITGTAKADTIAALKALDTTSATNYPDGTAVLVLGYYAAGDAAGTRVYRLNRGLSTTDDGGEYIAPTTGSGRWVLQWDGTNTNLCWWGANGNAAANPATGKTDNSVEFKRAADAVLARGGGGIFVPNGYYNFTSKLDLTSSIEYHKINWIGGGERLSNEGYANKAAAVLVARTQGMTLMEVGATETTSQSYGGPYFNYMNFKDGAGTNGAESQTCTLLRTNILNETVRYRCGFTGGKHGYVNFSHNLGKGRDNSVNFPSDFPRTDWTYWNSGTTYQIGQVVRITGTTNFYRATAVNTNSQPPNANWVSESDQDASWNLDFNCHYHGNIYGVCIAQSGGVSVEGHTRFEVPENGVGIALWGGSQHHVHSVKMDGKAGSVGIEVECESSTFYDIHAEDVVTLFKIRDNGGVSSGENNTFYGNKHYQSTSKYMFDIGSGANGNVEWGNDFRGGATGNAKIYNPSSVAFISDFSGSSAAVAPSSILLVGALNSPTNVWTDMPSALTEFKAQTQHRAYHDLTGYTEARLSLARTATGATGAVLAVQYSTNDGSTWNYLDNASGPSASLTGTGPVKSTWVTLAGAAVADVLIRLVGSGGDAIADPGFGNVYLQVR